MMNSVKDFRGKIEPPVEKAVLKIERYAQRLTQGYSAYGGSYLWAPDILQQHSTIRPFSAITYPKYNKYSSKVSATRNTYEKQ